MEGGDATLANLESLLGALQSIDANARSAAHTQLLALQQSPQVWSHLGGWIDSTASWNGGHSEEVGFFAAQTLLVKIHSGRWLEELSATQQADLLEWILTGLCRFSDASVFDEGASVILRDGLIGRKMGQVIAALVLAAYPTLWPDPIGDMLGWLQALTKTGGSTGRVRLILDGLSLVPSELEKMVPIMEVGLGLTTARPKADSNLYRLEHYLRAAVDSVYAGLAALTAHQVLRDHQGVIDQWYGTLQRWIAAYGEAKREDSGQSNLLGCLEFAAQAAYANLNVDKALELFEEMARSRTVESSTILALVRVASRLATSSSPSLSSSIGQLYLTLAEYHEAVIVKECFQNGNSLAFLETALKLSEGPRNHGVFDLVEDEDEELNRWLDFLSFWTFLQDGLGEDLTSSPQCQATFRALVERLLAVLARLPVSPHLPIATTSSLSAPFLLRIRTEVSFSICASMQVIGQASMLDLLVAYLGGSTSSGALLAGLFALESIAEDLCVGPLEAVCSSVWNLFRGLPQYGRDMATQRACLSLIGAYAPIISGNPEMLQSAVQMLLGATSDDGLVLVACRALEQVIVAWQIKEESNNQPILGMEGLYVLLGLAQQNSHNETVLKSLYPLIGSLLSSNEFCRNKETPMIFAQLLSLANGHIDSAMALIKATRFPIDAPFPPHLLAQIVPVLLDWCKLRNQEAKNDFKCGAAVEEIAWAFGGGILEAGLSPDIFLAACPLETERISLAATIAITYNDPQIFESAVPAMTKYTQTSLTLDAVQDHDEEFETVLISLCKVVELTRSQRYLGGSFLEGLFVAIVERLGHGNVGTPLLKAITRVVLLTIKQRDQPLKDRRMNVEPLLDRFFGLPLIEATMLALVKASPSQLETIGKLLYTLVTEGDPNTRRAELTNLMRQPAFPCATVGMAAKEQFLKQAVGTRNQLKFRQALCDLFNALR